jgi:peptide/nickel transport system substrate-binding protein
VTDRALDEKFSRRTFFKVGAGVAGAVGVGTILEACGGSSSSSGAVTTSATGAQTAPSAGKPKMGGTLMVGFTGGSSSDTVDGFNIYTSIDAARASALFEQLVQWNNQGQIENRLADEFSPNSDGSVWTIRLKPALTFHNGKPVTADDLIFTFQYMLNPKAPTLGSAAMVAVNPKGFKKLDSLTVRVQMTMPQTTWKEQLSVPFYFPVVPVGYDPKKPIGAGAFKLESFTPGQRSVMSRFDGYFISPEPYLDKVIVEDFPTSTSQINALTGGQINAAGSIPWVEVRELSGQPQVKIVNERSGQWNEYPMRTDVAPFNDVRVRQAIKLLIDRPQFVEDVYSGQAIIGNDVYARFDPDYNSNLPQRAQDPEKAKSLLKAAGADNYAFTLISGPWVPGLLEGAELIAQQANTAGVKVTVKNTPIGQFVAQDYLKAPWASGYWYDNPYAAQAILSMTKTAAQNETHWNNAQWNSLWNQLNKTPDGTSQYRDVIHQMQVIEWDQGGTIIPGFYNAVDAVASNVQGLAVPDTIGPLGGPHFERGWMS